MKKLSMLLQKKLKGWIKRFYLTFSDRRKNTQASALEKAWYTYQKEKDSLKAENDKQRELLYQFMHFHKEKDLN